MPEALKDPKDEARDVELPADELAEIIKDYREIGRASCRERVYVLV